MVAPQFREAVTAEYRNQLTTDDVLVPLIGARLHIAFYPAQPPLEIIGEQFHIAMALAKLRSAPATGKVLGIVERLCCDLMLDAIAAPVPPAHRRARTAEQSLFLLGSL